MTEVQRMLAQKKMANRKISYAVFGKTNKNNVSIHENKRIISSGKKPIKIRKQFLAIFGLTSLLYLVINFI
jgi:hypothetical protein